MPQNDTIIRYRANLQGEVNSASLCHALAEAGNDPHISEVYRGLAVVEEAHAEFWRNQLVSVGARVRDLAPVWRSRSFAWLARRFGPQLVLPTITRFERADSSHYDNQLEASATCRAVFPAALARLEGRHRRGGNTLWAAVLGANDGLVSNLSLVMAWPAPLPRETPSC